jgi:hypothetical protein
VTITNWLGYTVKLHSSSLSWSPQHNHRPNQLLVTLASWENQSLWKHLRINGGAGDWIFSSLMQGLLVIGHDNSYMPHLANNVCACAAVIYCSHPNQFTDVTWVEKSTKKAANNYRTEILGGCSTQLIIQAAITGRNVLSHGTLTVGCNYMGVVRHGNSPQHPMLEKQPQSDVLQYFKGLMASSRVRGRMQHVYSHADKYLLEAKMSPAQWVNCWADKLATGALIAAVEAHELISSIFPSEKVCVEIVGEWVTGSPKNKITELWGEQVAQALYDRWGVVSKENFPFGYWEGMEHVLKSFPEMFRIWVTKHVSMGGGNVGRPESKRSIIHQKAF